MDSSDGYYLIDSDSNMNDFQQENEFTYISPQLLNPRKSLTPPIFGFSFDSNVITPPTENINSSSAPKQDIVHLPQRNHIKGMTKSEIRKYQVNHFDDFYHQLTENEYTSDELVLEFNRYFEDLSYPISNSGFGRLTVLPTFFRKKIKRINKIRRTVYIKIV